MLPFGCELIQHTLHGRRATAPRHLGAIGGLLPFVLLLGMETASGQNLPLKRSLPEESEIGVCPPLRSGSPPPPGTAAKVDSLIAAGGQAAILGDPVTARDLLQRAAALHPHHPVVAYRLARTYDELGEAGSAVVEYCRYITLAPAAPDVAGVRERVRALGAGHASAHEERLAVDARAGMDAYDRGRFVEAANAFTRGIETRPGWADAYYNRALAHLAERQWAEAIRDLEAYLELLPTAEDRPAVLARIRQLSVIAEAGPQPARAGALAPTSVLMRGLALPGLGQHATGRTGWGLLVLGGVAGAVYYGLQPVEVVRSQGAYDPFGNYYEYELRGMERANFVPGIGAAATMLVAGAIEAFLYARQGRGTDRAVSSASDRPQPAPIRFQLIAVPGSLGFDVRIPATP